MLPPEYRLEIRSRIPERNAHDSRPKPALLFVHGGYCDGWCWEPYFLPFFAARGYPAHALSLRGHGGSGGRETLFAAGLDDFAADVEHVASTLPAPPVLIGHSMGAAVIERLMGAHPVRAAALIAPVPPAGLLPTAARLAVAGPDYLLQMSRFDPTRLDARALATLRPFYFSDEVDPQILQEAVRHLSVESPRALIDLSLRLHWLLPERGMIPIFVLGAEGDRICPPRDVAATSRHHGVEAEILPGLSHMLMLDRGWRTPASRLLHWLATL